MTYIERTHNIATNKIIDIELTGADLKKRQDEEKVYLAEQAKIEATQNAKNAARSELLNKLGITEEEAKLLLS